jgi:hypothetical protein
MGKFMIKHPLTVTVGGETHEYVIRELGYLEYDEIQRKALSGLIESNKNNAGMELMKAVVVASVQELDGSQSYTEEEWRTELKDVVLQVGKAAMKAQGVDLDSRKEDAEPMTEEQVEGNDEPSRMSGANSRLTSAAPLQSLKTG